MQVELARVRVIARHGDVDGVLEDLYRQRVLELADARELDGARPLDPGEDRAGRREHLRLLAARLEGTLAVAGGGAPAIDGDPVDGTIDVARLGAELDALAPLVDEHSGRVEALRAEQLTLERYERPLERLLALVPELAELEEHELAGLGLDTIALVLAVDDDALVESLRDELRGLLGDRFVLEAARVDERAVGCLLVVPHAQSAEVHALLGREHVRSVPLPDAYARLSLAGALRAMQRRLVELPAERAAASERLRALVAPHAARWARELAGVRAELEQLDAVDRAAATSRTFVVEGWCRTADLDTLRARLEEATGGAVAIEVVAEDRHAPGRPVLLRHSRPVGPFATLVRFFDLPSPGGLDPSGLMALFLPLLFGAMVGDVGYGLGLAALAWWANRRFGAASPVARDVSRVLAWCAGWSIVFGFLFGEFLGNLGKDVVGDFALWFYRGDENALEPLLLFAVAIGAAHIVLGLLLGAWAAWRERHRGELAERLGTLGFLVGLFALAGAAADVLPAGLLTPAVALMVLGAAAVLPAHGRMGALVAPLELIGVLGNVLSYLRVAAVGLASVYLAIVANEFAAEAPLVLGLLVAAFFHALNLALAAFSPFVQSLRLHYVEFFSKFHAGGGRAFRAFGDPTPDPTTP